MGRRATVWNLADWALPPILLLLLAPLLLFWLGPTGFGIWALCLAVTGLALVPASALADAGTRAVARHCAADGRMRPAAVMTACLLPAGVIAGFLAIAVVIVAPYVSRLLPGMTMAQAETAQHAMSWTGALIIARSLDIVLGGVLAGGERYDLSARAGIPTNGAVAVAWLLLASHGGGPGSLIAASSASSLLCAAIKMFAIRRISGPPLFARPLRADIHEVAHFAWRSTLQGAGAVLIHQVDRIILASFAGPAPLAAYALCLQLAQNVHIAVSRGAAVVFPRTSLLAAHGDLAGLRLAYDKGMRHCAIAGAALGAPLVACAHPLLEVWAGAGVADTATGQLATLAAVYAALATTVMPYYVLNAVGAAGFNAVMGWLCGTAVVVCALLLVPHGGADGAAWSRFAAVPVGMACQVAIHRRIFSANRPWHALAAYAPAALAILAAILAAPWIASLVHGTVSLAIALVASLIAAASLAWIAAGVVLPLPSAAEPPRLAT